MSGDREPQGYSQTEVTTLTDFQIRIGRLEDEIANNLKGLGRTQVIVATHSNSNGIEHLVLCNDGQYRYLEKIGDAESTAPAVSNRTNAFAECAETPLQFEPRTTTPAESDALRALKYAYLRHHKVRILGNLEQALTRIAAEISPTASL